MAKKNKLSTPAWIIEGYDSKDAYEKAKGTKSETPGKEKKVFSVKKCPECGSYEVNVAVGEEAVGKWECKSCNWTGRDIEEKELKGVANAISLSQPNIKNNLVI